MKVLISGYYGFGNLGDEALLAGLLAGLHDRGHHPIVLSGNPALTSVMHRVRATHRLSGALPTLLECDALISGGGGLLQDATSTRSLRYYLTLIRAARAFRKRVVVFGQSLGPLSPNGWQRVTRALGPVAVAVRDSHSQRQLAEHGITAELVADTALLLYKIPVDRPHRQTTGPTLLIPRSGFPDITAALADVARALTTENITVAVLPLHPEQDEQDAETIARAAGGADILMASTPHEALGYIATSRYVISARLHGLILAAAAFRNFCGLIYDPKVAAFLHEADAPAFSPPIDSQALITTALERPDVPRRALEALKSRAATGLDWLDRVLRQEA